MSEPDLTALLAEREELRREVAYWKDLHKGQSQTAVYWHTKFKDAEAEAVPLRSRLSAALAENERWKIGLVPLGEALVTLRALNDEWPSLDTDPPEGWEQRRNKACGKRDAALQIICDMALRAALARPEEEKTNG